MLRSGAALMVYASVCFSLMAALVKFVSPRIPIFEIVLWRCVLAVPFLLFLVRRERLPLLVRNRKIIAIRTLFGFGAMSLFFLALGQLTIADALLLSKMQPLWIAVLAPFLLREHLAPRALFTVVVSIAGAALVLKPTLSIGNIGGVAMIGAALMSGLAHMSVRRLSADDSTRVIVLNFMVGTAILALPLAIPSFVVPNAIDTVALLGISVLATAGQLLMTRAYAREEAPVVAAAGYSSVAFGILWGVLFWNTVPNAWTWSGGGLLVGAGLFLVWLRRNAPAHAYVAD